MACLILRAQIKKIDLQHSMNPWGTCFALKSVIYIMKHIESVKSSTTKRQSELKYTNDTILSFPHSSEGNRLSEKRCLGE